MCHDEVVAYKRLKTINNYNGRDRLREFLTIGLWLGNNLVFWVGGRFWEVVAHGCSIVYRNTW